MKSFSATIDIHASSETIWAILIDVANWPSWNPTVTKVEGKIALGEKISLYFKSTPDRTFPLTVSEYAPKERMVFSGGMPLGLFKGDRTFTLTQKTDGIVAFSMREVFSGLMAPLITRSIPDLQPSFEEFAASLKTKAEQAL
ncbi:SRPBCC domain-containing protein [Tumidithrix elongata RA019]|uniref:SRPBCC domain-containing protein n=1 Tax=Tumidithrix elongata BACA0141 TaxID=2716417 RepID=A0AAW9PWK7_9CYAN|nr:SRPBCC domain-containing protein [Tumidithrix elongata RA019]